MNFLKLLRFFTLIFSVFATQTLFATDRSFEDWERKSDLWQAFHLFETNNLKEAAEIIKDYQAGCPIVYPYFEYLHKHKDHFITEQPLPSDQIVNYSSVHLKHIDPIFNSSLVILEIGKNSKKRNKLLGDGRLLNYNKARHLETNPNQRFGVPLNLYINSVDPRSILAVRRLNPATAKSSLFKGVSYYEIAFYMQSMLQEHSKTADVLFGCAQHFRGTENLWRYFLDWSAGYGHAEAQVVCAELSITPELKSFFYGQAALNGNLSGISAIARAFERKEGVQKDVCKAFAHYKQAAEHPDAEGIHFHNLAAVYENGIGTQVNIETAIKFYIQAIQNEYTESTVHAARLLHRQGKHEKAFEYIQKAIEAKQVEDSEGIKQWLPRSYTETDLEKAVNFWSAKAEQDNRMAREYLAELILLYLITHYTQYNLEGMIASK
jgi:TPR repeat protein